MNWRRTCTFGGLGGPWAAAVLLAATDWCAAGELRDAFRFGQAELGSQLTCRFDLANSGSEPLEVVAVEPSCDCLQVTHWPATVPPGETGRVDVLFVPDVVGEVDYRVAMQFAPGKEMEDVFAIQGEVVEAPQPAPPRDWAIYVDMPEDEKLAADPGRAVWVDVRASELHEQVRIPGSLSIPLHAIKTKGFLRNKRVVLVDEGGGSRRLEEECFQLSADGFSNVKIWYGGMNAWRRFGGPVEGAFPGFPVDELMPAVLSDVLGAEDWLVVSIGRNGSGLAQVVSLAWEADRMDAFLAALNEAIEERPAVESVLIITENGEVPPVLANALRKLDVLVFHLKGGWAAWVEHRRTTAYRPPSISYFEPSTPSSVTPRRRCRGCSKTRF